MAESGEDLLDSQERAVFNAKVLSGEFKAAAGTTSADPRGRAPRQSSTAADTAAAVTTRRTADLPAISGLGQASVRETEWGENEGFGRDGNHEGDVGLWNDTAAGEPPNDSRGSSDDEMVGGGEGVAVNEAAWQASRGNNDAGVEDG